MAITNITERERELQARVAELEAEQHTDAILIGAANASAERAIARQRELEAELASVAIENKSLTEFAMMQREFKEPDDVEFGLIEQAATASFMKHQRSIKGQQITRSDSYETHLVWAAKAFYASAQPVPEGYQLLKNTTMAERSFDEDALHGNSSYFFICKNCDRQFVGHKRSQICKTCESMLAAAKEMK